MSWTWPDRNITSGTNFSSTAIWVNVLPKGWHYHQGYVAEPISTREASGMTVLHWPADAPTTALVAKELLEDLVRQSNELAILRRWVERDVS